MKKLPEHLIPNYDAAPSTASYVQGEHYRFTVLTSRLLGLGYSEDGVFEDRATQSVICRKLDVTKYTSAEQNGVLRLETDELLLIYKIGRDFKSGLTVTLKHHNSWKEPIWAYGDECENLGGTARTLDRADGEIPLSQGVCAKCGYAALDDSSSGIILDSGMIEPRKKGIIDVYFFGYGFDYISAVRDLMRLTGAPPLLPAFALGNWWSRYHKYTQDEYIKLIERYEKEDIPFSVAIIDMDWHLVDIPKEYGNGWTGYTWNRELFPDYKAFLKFLKKKGYAAGLADHPALGVRAFEDFYEDMAKAMGVDPESREAIPFDLNNEDFIKPYFEILHNRYESDGIDFWWIDWQQGTRSSLEGLDPLWLLNHFHSLDITRKGKRPFIYSRFAGPGSQRFPIGFSGDAWVTWDSLNFQPKFTATASNIAYPWWSHDIGGHCCGYRDDELMMRWTQLGTFSPINKLHSSWFVFNRREPWCFNTETEASMKQFLRLRHALFPYLYTMNWRTHKELIPLVCPIYYYCDPEKEATFKYQNSFFFGSEMVIFPITAPSDDVTKLGCAKGYLPEGNWVDFFRGTRYKGDRELCFYRNGFEYPVLCKAGAIVPMNTLREHDNSLGSFENMEIRVFPGADGKFVLYEDLGEGNGYRDGEFATTEYALEWSSNKAEFKINAAEGDLSLIPQKRNYTLCFRGFCEEIEVSCEQNGKQIPFNTRYDDATCSLYVTVDSVSTDGYITVTLESKINNFAPSDKSLYDRMYDVILGAQMDYNTKQRVWEHLTRDDLNSVEKLQNAILEGLSPALIGAIAELLG